MTFKKITGGSQDAKDRITDIEGSMNNLCILMWLLVPKFYSNSQNTAINPLKPNGCCMYWQHLRAKILHSATECVSYGSQNKQQFLFLKSIDRVIFVADT
jgi:hypothetical protein